MAHHPWPLYRPHMKAQPSHPERGRTACASATYRKGGPPYTRFAMQYQTPHVEFPTHVAGIPCRVSAHITYGHSGNLYEPPESTEVYDLTITDRRGRPAQWLTAKLDRYETHRLKQEALEADAAQWEDF